LLPDEAIGSDQSQKYVFIVGAESKAEYRPVEIGPLVDGLRVVRSGITPQDWVVVAGLQRVRPGLTVEAQRDAISLPLPGTEGAEAKQQ
jgi:multidrug efflux system membrane fusion protein